MDKLKINDNGVIKKIEYTDKYGTGIFLAKGSKVVKQNCKELNIRLDENLELYEICQKVTKIGKTGFLTIKADNLYFQYIIQDYADEFSFNRLLSSIPPQSKEALLTAYNLTKIDNLNSLSMLGNIMDNKN